MRKRILISFVTVALMAVTAVFFTACSQDEAEEDAVQSKVELLKAKAKEFAQKYGVEMSLNEDNLEELAKTLTVEQMEEDFKAFADLKSFALVSQNNALVKTDGLKIRRSKTLKEEADENNNKAIEEREKAYTGSMTKEVHCKYHWKSKDKLREVFSSLSGWATVTWQYDPKKSNFVTVGLQLTGIEEEPVTGGFNLLASFSTSSGFSFIAKDTGKAKSTKYVYGLYVNAEYVRNELTVSISQAE